MALVENRLSSQITVRDCFFKKHSTGKVSGDDRFVAILLITGSSVILLGCEPLVQLLMMWNIVKSNSIVLIAAHTMPGKFQKVVIVRPLTIRSRAHPFT
ncbi:hypothetical protein DICVIV_01468 [Dictyocaulus viviparus]|uniref:Uncharacterized protein n=1 Tax=Dictyocaulus viviparus TaxID=29172 RepID=A0A0D8YCR7_DICVI|nr:hypothetical protein DICVIV_01468 [Dictyocaulus viviparus]